MADDFGDEHEDELVLLRHISAKDRLDAILESKHLSTGEAVAALDAHFRENQATFPHVAILNIGVSEGPEGDRSAIQTLYVGPFRNRRAAEEWAGENYADVEEVRCEFARIDTPEMVADERRRLNAMLKRDRDEDD